jgi:hypothetical protein
MEEYLRCLRRLMYEAWLEVCEASAVLASCGEQRGLHKFYSGLNIYTKDSFCQLQISIVCVESVYMNTHAVNCFHQASNFYFEPIWPEEPYAVTWPQKSPVRERLRKFSIYLTYFSGWGWRNQNKIGGKVGMLSWYFCRSFLNHCKGRKSIQDSATRGRLKATSPLPSRCWSSGGIMK